MELRHLRYFVAVAEEEHMSRAARRLNIQQPPLSKQIQQLEQELGVTLFLRQPRKITLNAAGKVFLSDARRILAATSEAVARVRQFDLGQEGSVRVGFTSSASMHPLTLSILDRFRRDYPLVTLKIEEGANHDLLHMVEQERLDVAFVRSAATRYPTLSSRVIAMEDMVVAVPADHALAKADGVDLESLAGEDLILYQQANGAGIGELLTGAMSKRGLSPRIVETPQRILAALNLVAAGFGVAGVPASLKALQLPRVVYIPLIGPGQVAIPLNVAFRTYLSAESVNRFLKVVTTLADPEPQMTIAKPGSTAPAGTASKPRAG